MALVGDFYEYHDKRFYDLTVPIAEVEELFRVPLGGGPGVVQRRRLSGVERHSQQPHAALDARSGVSVYRARRISPMAIPATARAGSSPASMAAGV